jgi:hypothetical protein
MKRNIKKGLIATAVPVAMLLATSAEAAFLPAFEGFSVFGAGANQCPLCDSTVSFAVWQNTDGNWIDDLPTPTDLGPATTGTEQYVYMYQVINTDPLNVQNQILENFNVSFGPQGGPTVPTPFLAGGFFDNTVFNNPSSAIAPLDTPDDGVPSALSTVTPFTVNTSAFDPNSLSANIMANPAVGGGAAYPGALFQWNAGNEIPAAGTSSVLFMTSNLAPTYRWAETESPGGFGAAGDVPSMVPVPAAVWLFGSGLLGLIGIARRRKTA